MIKKLFIFGLFILILCQFSFAKFQKAKNNIASLEVNGGLNYYQGNNIMNSSYNFGYNIGINAGFTILDNLGVGLLYDYTILNIKDTKYIGLSTNAKINGYGGYILGYIVISKNFLISPKIGLESITLKNELFNNLDNEHYPYYTNGFSFFIQNDCIYMLNADFALSLNFAYSYKYFDKMQSSSATDVSFKDSHEFRTSLGIKVFLNQDLYLFDEE